MKCINELYLFDIGTVDGDRGSEAIQNRSQCTFCFQHWWNTHGRNSEKTEPRNNPVHHCFQGQFFSYKVIWSLFLTIANSVLEIECYKYCDNCFSDIYNTRNHHQCWVCQSLATGNCQGGGLWWKTNEHVDIPELLHNMTMDNVIFK